MCTEKYEHLFQLEMADTVDGTTTKEIDVLIGLDHYWDLVTGEIQRGASGPVAIQTQLGWVLSGPAHMHTLDQDSTSLLVTHALRTDAQTTIQDNLEDSLHAYWKLESLGVQVSERSVMEEFQEKIQFKHGR